MPQNQLTVSGAGPIIIVEDQERDRVMLREIKEMSRVSNELKILPDADSFFAYISDVERGIEPQPEIVFLDIRMPDMTGFELLDEFQRKWSQLAGQISVAFLTSSSNPEDQREAVKLGADGYVTKKNRIDDFVSFFNSLVNDHNQQ